jgi:hypothetical protein
MLSASADPEISYVRRFWLSRPCAASRFLQPPALAARHALTEHARTTLWQVTQIQSICAAEVLIAYKNTRHSDSAIWS